MHNGQGRRRHRGTGRVDDDATATVSRAAEPHTSFTRSHQPSPHSEGYRTVSTLSRIDFPMNREGPSSSRHRSDSWQAAETSFSSTAHDRYNAMSPGDGFNPQHRNDFYDRSDSRNTDSWEAQTPSRAHYSSSSSREWVARADQGHGFASSSYTESASWSAARFHTNGGEYERWRGREPRVSHDSERGRERYTGDRRSGGDGQSWRTEESPERNSRIWRLETDDWAPMPGEVRKDRGGQRQLQGGRRDDTRTGDDRSWEPAPSWQGDRPANQIQQKQIQKKKSKGKKGQQKRDWRIDDGQTNNWQRRDTHGNSNNNKNTHAGAKRRSQRSSSESRSRSRARSTYSRLSSRGRSRSRSKSPKRRRRNFSVVDRDGRSPSDRPMDRTTAHGHPPSRSPASSRRSRDGRGRPRRDSLSSLSSRSFSRSPSRSPSDRPKAFHRLPVATSIKEITVPLSPLSTRRGTASSMLPPRSNERSKNGKVAINGKHRQLARDLAHLPLPSEISPGGTTPSTTMPPPAALSDPRPEFHALIPDYCSASTADDSPPRGPRMGKNAGFKPIGQASSSIKRFFPGDDDESDAGDVKPAIAAANSGSRAHFVSALKPLAVEHNMQGVSVIQTGEYLPRHPRAMEQPWNGTSAQWQSDEAVSRGMVAAEEQSFDRGGGSSRISPSSYDVSRRSSVHDDVKHFDILSTKITSPSNRTLEVDQEQAHLVGSMSDSRPQEFYTILSQVGEGTFGKVYKARNTSSGLHVALKRIRMESERDGFPVTAMREIKLLQSLRQENVVRLYEMMVSNGSVYMVFEYMDHDLTGILSQAQFSFTDAHLKSLCQQMLAGLGYLHRKGVIHRDIKGSNILVNNRGELKLGDFGLARFYQKRRQSDYTNRVITLWYRPPELLLGSTVYGPEVDMWSAGCIMLELFTKKPVFQGNDEIHQLDVMYKLLGTPTRERWPGVTDLPWYELVKPKEPISNHFRELFEKWLSPAGLDLAEQLLAFDPAQRVSAVRALQTAYFKEELPPPKMPTDLCTLEGEWHELETKRERAKKRKKTDGATQ